MQPEVVLVVVTYNSARDVPDLLDCVPAALAGVHGAVIVVDNGSQDETVAVLRARGDCQVVEAENRGYAAGINRGVAAGPPAPAILVLNPDVRLQPGSVPEMLRALALPRVGVVAPKILEVDGSVSRSLRREPTLGRASGLGFTRLPAFSEYVTAAAAYQRAHPVDWALGAVLLLRRECYDELGGWDESFFLYSEETDFCLRARDRGWLTRFEPSAVAVHIGGGSGQSDRTHVMQIVNRVRFYVRRRGSVRGWLYWAATIASEATWLARGHRQSRAAIRALLAPRSRPPELGCSAHVLPR